MSTPALGPNSDIYRCGGRLQLFLITVFPSFRDAAPAISNRQSKDCLYHLLVNWSRIAMGKVYLRTRWPSHLVEPSCSLNFMKCLVRPSTPFQCMISYIISNKEDCLSLTMLSLFTARGWNEAALILAHRQGLSPSLCVQMIYDDTMGLENLIQSSIRVS